MSPSASISAILAALVLLLPAASAWAEDLPAEVRFGYLNGPRPWILGKLDKSFDSSLGAQVVWQNFQSGPPAIESLSRGETDILRVGSVPVAAALIRQAPLKIIAISGIIDTSERLAAKNSVRTVKDLENQAVGAVYGSTSHYALLAAMDAYGVDASKVRIVFMEPQEFRGAWERGEIAAAWIWGPWWFELAERGGHILLSSGDLNRHGFYLFNVFAESLDFAERHPELLVSFLRNYQRKLDEYNADRPAAAERIARELGQDLRGAGATLDGLFYPPISEQLNVEWLGSGEDTPGSAIARSFEDQARFLVRQSEVSEWEVPDSFAPFINSRFIAGAVR